MGKWWVSTLRVYSFPKNKGLGTMHSSKALGQQAYDPWICCSTMGNDMKSTGPVSVPFANMVGSEVDSLVVIKRKPRFFWEKGEDTISKYSDYLKKSVIFHLWNIYNGCLNTSRIKCKAWEWLWEHHLYLLLLLLILFY